MCCVLYCGVLRGCCCGRQDRKLVQFVVKCTFGLLVCAVAQGVVTGTL